MGRLGVEVIPRSCEGMISGATDTRMIRNRSPLLHEAVLGPTIQPITASIGHVGRSARATLEALPCRRYKKRGMTRRGGGQGVFRAC